jgi:hypothetical protein
MEKFDSMVDAQIQSCNEYTDRGLLNHQHFRWELFCSKRVRVQKLKYYGNEIGLHKLAFDKQSLQRSARYDCFKGSALFFVSIIRFG